MSIADLFGFPGGVRLPGHKAASTSEPVTELPLPKELVIPLGPHEGDPAEAVVAVGDRVARGICLGRPASDFAVPVHAPTSGTITAIEPRRVPHPSGLPESCVILAADGEDRRDPDAYPPLHNWPTLSPATLRQRIAACGVAGLGGAAFPATVKLTPPADCTIHTLILNALECEPWITCDDMLLREQAEDVITGARIMAHILGAERIIIALEEDKHAARQSLEQALQPQHETTIGIMPVPALYPAGGEKQLIHTLTGREVPAGGLPAEIGVLCHNAGTAAAAARAVCQGEPLTERIVTVAGTGIGAPRNLRVRLGTPVHALLQATATDPDGLERLIVGGPMMGFTLETADIPVTKGFNCLLATTVAPDTAPEPAMPCIRCGDCAEVCPMILQPQQLYWHARNQDFDDLRRDGLFDCIECGACAYVCPSHIPLVGIYRHAKSAIRDADREQQEAEAARQRYEFRQARLERERRERDERRRRKKEALHSGAETSGTPDRKAEIQAAIARARARKRGGGEDQ